MKFKKLKYNLICIISCLIIISAVVCNAFFGFNKSMNNLPPDEQNENQNPEDNPGSESQGDNNVDDQTQQPDVQEPQEEFDFNLPSTKYPQKFLNYCIKKLAESQGYKATSTINTTFTAVGVMAENKTKVTVYKSGEEYYECSEYRPNETSALFTDYKFTQLVYYDGTNSHMWTTPENTWDLSNSKYELQEGRYEFYNNMLDPCPQFDKKAASIDPRTERDKQGNTYYVVTARLLDMSHLPYSFTREYSMVKGFGSISSFDQSIEFTITENGWITQILKKETFKGSALGVDLSGTIIFTEKITNHNQPQTFDLPPKN